jgi:hypothetical protein
MTPEQVGVLKGLVIGVLGGLFVAGLYSIAVDYIIAKTKKEALNELRK